VWKKSVILLFIFNLILLSAGWIMTVSTYPKLPQKMPLWLNFFGQQPIIMEKSLLFFIYPLAQTLFFMFFLIVSRRMSSKNMIPWKANILKEYIYLTLIFFNLIFIHLQRSLILLARQIEEGVDKFYFYSLFGIIFLLIPYYRLRLKLHVKKRE